MKFRSVLLSMVFALFATAYAGADLVGLWAFNEGSGGVAGDSSGNGNDGVINNAVWADGIYGGALEFNGKNANVEVEYSPELSAEEYTLMAWINVPGFTGGGQTIATQLAEDNAPSRNYWMSINAGGRIDTSFSSNSGNTWQILSATSRIVDGEWHHIAVTYNKALFRCYVDGVVDGEKPIDGEPVPDKADTVMTIGSAVGAGWILGRLDEVALYNHALSEDDINDVMLGLSSSVEPADKLATSWGGIKAR
ncbi:LamG domain-containing protein [Candidatus Poribacteria bacterium]